MFYVWKDILNINKLHLYKTKNHYQKQKTTSSHQPIIQINELTVRTYQKEINPDMNFQLVTLSVCWPGTRD